MIITLNDYYDDRDSLIKAALRDAVYKRTAKTKTAFNNATGHRDVLTTTREAGFNNYHMVEEIQPLAFQVIETTGLNIYGCWANVNKTQHWLGPHNHNRDGIKAVAIYYAQVQDGETLDFDDDIQIELNNNMLITFDSTVVHSFKPVERTSDKIVVSFELF